MFANPSPFLSAAEEEQGRSRNKSGEEVTGTVTCTVLHCVYVTGTVTCRSVYSVYVTGTVLYFIVYLGELALMVISQKD